MIIGEAVAVGELWDAARDVLPAAREDRPGQPVYAISEPPPPGDSGLRAARHADLDVLVPACAAAHALELGIDPLARGDDGFRWRTSAQIDERRSWVVDRGRRRAVQGRGFGLDAERGAAAAGVGRSGRARPRLRVARRCAT